MECPNCLSVGIAAKEGDANELKSLISKGHFVDLADIRGWRPLHEASVQSVGCMEELLKHDDNDVNWQTYDGETALLLACQRSHADTLKAVNLLIKHGADVNLSNNDDETPLLAATRSKLTDVVRVLLNTGMVDTNLGNPLHIAVELGSHACLQLLLDAGFEVNNAVPEVKDSDDEDYPVPLPELQTPLYKAFVLRDMRSAKLLIKYGADVNSPISPPMYAAILHVNHHYIDFLVDNGADLKPHDLIFFAVHEPLSLFHLLRRGADAGNCLNHSVSALVDAVSKIETQEYWLLAVDVLLDFVINDFRTSNFVSAVIAKSREVFDDDHESKEWNQISKSVAEPSSLMVICRVTLRRHLSNVRGAIFGNDTFKLEIPISLLSFLVYEELNSV